MEMVFTAHEKIDDFLKNQISLILLYIRPQIQKERFTIDFRRGNQRAAQDFGPRMVSASSACP